MKEKARKSLEDGLHLLERGSVDSASNRLYFALFQAAIHGLERIGLEPADFRAGASRWDHGTIARQILLVRGRREDAELFKTVRDLRVDADYRKASVLRGRLEFVKHEVARFVREVTA